MTTVNSARLVNCLGKVYAGRHRIADRFYHNLFAEMPEIEPMFAKDFHKQKEMFSMMTTMLARSVASSNSLEPIARQLRRSHASFDISRAQFTIGGDILHAAFDAELGDKIGDCDREALRDAIDRLIDIMDPDKAA